MHIAHNETAQPVGEMPDHKRIEALEAEVVALKASNACLVQSRDETQRALAEFGRAAVLSAQMFANAAENVYAGSTDLLEMNEPG